MEVEHAVAAVRLRFGDQALVRASRLPARVQAWPTGIAVIDRLTGIGGLPRGRVSVFMGRATCGKMSVALALLARATHEHAHVVVVDADGRFDPSMMGAVDIDLERLTVIRPPTPGGAGEAAVELARAGVGLLLSLGGIPEPALAPLEAAAARSGCIVLALAPKREPALAHAASITFGFERFGWLWKRRQMVGLRTRVTCLKSKVGAPGRVAQLEICYPIGPLVIGELVREMEDVEREARADVDGEVASA